jgi:hypothetical protein
MKKFFGTKGTGKTQMKKYKAYFQAMIYSKREVVNGLPAGLSNKHLVKVSGEIDLDAPSFEQAYVNSIFAIHQHLLKEGAIYINSILITKFIDHENETDNSKVVRLPNQSN